MGGAYVAMSSKQMRTDLAFAWPTAQIAVMGAAPAVRVLYREEVRNAADPVAREAELIASYRERFFNPCPHERAARRGPALAVANCKDRLKSLVFVVSWKRCELSWRL